MLIMDRFNPLPACCSEETTRLHLIDLTVGIGAPAGIEPATHSFEVRSRNNSSRLPSEGRTPERPSGRWFSRAWTSHRTSTFGVLTTGPNFARSAGRRPSGADPGAVARGLFSCLHNLHRGKGGGAADP